MNGNIGVLSKFKYLTNEILLVVIIQNCLRKLQIQVIIATMIIKCFFNCSISFTEIMAKLNNIFKIIKADNDPQIFIFIFLFLVLSKFIFKHIFYLLFYRSIITILII